jgi:protein-tyrosine phosphatase
VSTLHSAPTTDRAADKGVGASRLLDRLRQSRAAQGLKLAIRETVWMARGLRLGNPPLPSGARTLMFVCKGNICRSPFAAALASKLLQEAGRSTVRSASAGLKPSSDGACPDDAVAAADAYGVAAALAAHRPVELTTELVDSHDLVVAMEASQLAELMRRWPERRARFVLLPLFEPHAPVSAYERFNIADPFGKGPAEFERIYRRTDAAVRGLIAAIDKNRE